MKSDRPVIGAVICLAIALALIFGYCRGTASASIAFPFAGSNLHFDLTTTGVAVLGGVVFLALGVLFLVWAFIAAIVGQISLLFHREDRIESILDRKGTSSFDADADSEGIR